MFYQFELAISMIYIFNLMIRLREWNIQSLMENNIQELNVQMENDLKYYYVDFINPEALIQYDIEIRDKLQKELHKMQYDNFSIYNLLLLAQLGHLSYMTYKAANAGIKVAYKHYSMWKEKELVDKFFDLQEKFEELSQEKKEEMVNSKLAIKDHANIFFLHYTCPISYSLIINPVVLHIQKKPDHYELEIYEKSSIINYFEITSYPPQSPLSRLPLLKLNGQYWSEPHEDLKRDHANYLESLTQFINRSEISEKTLTSSHSHKR